MKNMLSLFLVAATLITVSCKKDKNEEKKETNPEGTWQQVAATGGMNPVVSADKTYKITLLSSGYKLFKKDAQIASGTYSIENRTEKSGNKEVIDVILNGISNDFQPGLILNDTLYLGNSITDGPIYIFTKQ